MKKFALAAALTLAASTAFAGGMAQPVVEPTPMVDVTTHNSSSAGGIVVPLLLLLVLGSVVIAVVCGIAGILNFSPIVLQVPEDVIVNSVNVAIELENLSYFIQD